MTGAKHTATLPDGTVATRTSKTHVYTHIVAVRDHGAPWSAANWCSRRDLAAKYASQQQQYRQPEIVEQVANTHPTNLRNDMDDIKDLIERLSRSVSNMRAVTDETRADVRETRQDIQIIRTEMRDDRASLDAERQARQDLDSKADRTHTEIFGRLNRIEGKS